MTSKEETEEMGKPRRTRITRGKDRKRRKKELGAWSS
jgi:hypothetical protein